MAQTNHAPAHISCVFIFGTTGKSLKSSCRIFWLSFSLCHYLQKRRSRPLINFTSLMAWPFVPTTTNHKPHLAGRTWSSDRNISICWVCSLSTPQGPGPASPETGLSGGASIDSGVAFPLFVQYLSSTSCPRDTRRRRCACGANAAAFACRAGEWGIRLHDVLFMGRVSCWRQKQASP